MQSGKPTWKPTACPFYASKNEDIFLRLEEVLASIIAAALHPLSVDGEGAGG